MERIRVSDISSSYGRRKVLSNVSISADKGQCVGIIGKNGCGKSTFLNILAGLRKADAGDIFFDGQRAAGKSAGVLFKSYTGYVPQDNNLIPELNVMDNLRLWYRDGKTLKMELENGFLHELGLDEMSSLKAGRLSGGMKKRVSIGCALAGNPPILILDEPCAALDLPGKSDIRKYLDMYKKRGGVIIIATHDEGDFDLCDRIYVLTGGVSRETDHNFMREGYDGKNGRE